MSTLGTLLQPLYKYRFRVARCPEEISLNMVNMTVDNVAKKIEMWVRVTVDPASMQAALDFGNYRNFLIDHLDGFTKKPYYSLSPTNLKLVHHTFELDYAKSDPVVHYYVWSFDHLDIYVAEGKESANQMPPKVDSFLTPQEAVDKLTSAPASSKHDDDIGDPRTAGC